MHRSGFARRLCAILLVGVPLAGCQAFQRSTPEAPAAETPAVPAPAVPAQPAVAGPVTLAPEHLETGLVQVRTRLARSGRWVLADDRVGYFMDVLYARLLSLADRGITASRHGQVIRVQVSGATWFAMGGADLTAEASTELAPLVDVLREFDRSVVCVIGHTDDQGAPQANQRLSLQRAKVVARQLVKAGIRPERLVVTGAGATQPDSANDDDAGRELNRRVEFRLLPITR